MQGRWRAAQIAGLTENPPRRIVRKVPDDVAIAMVLIQNIQREDLNPLEEARALHRLIDEFQMTHSAAADVVGRSRAAVTNLLRLLELTLKWRLSSSIVSLRWAMRVRCSDCPIAVVSWKWVSSLQERHRRETEAIVRRMQQPSASADVEAGDLDPNVERLQNYLAEKLGAKVTIAHGRSGKGKLVVTYNSLDELEGDLGYIQ